MAGNRGCNARAGITLYSNGAASRLSIASGLNPSRYHTFKLGLLVVLVAEGVSVLDQPSIHRGKGYPVCQNCGKRMRLVQRGPRFDDSGYYERQVFACCYCDHHIERSVKTDGVARGLAHDVIE
jgi:hypothetical protein